MEEGTDRRVQTVCLVIIASILGAAALYWLRPVMIPFVLAVLLSYLLTPCIEMLRAKLRVPRMGAILIVLLVGLLLFFALAGLLASSAKDISQNAGAYQTKVAQLVHDGSAWLRERGWNVDAGSVKAQLMSADWGRAARKLANGLVTGLSNTFLVLIFAVYLLQGTSLRRKSSSAVRNKIEGRIKRYISIKIALSAATGALTAAILAILGVKAALLFGILAFLLNFIPSVGSIVAVALPLPLVLFEPSVSGLTIALAFILPALVQVIVGNVVEPKALGDSLKLHPITILLSLVFWGMLWGVPGMILATPLSAAICVLLDSRDGTKALARLMSGESPSNMEPEPEHP